MDVGGVCEGRVEVWCGGPLPVRKTGRGRRDVAWHRDVHRHLLGNRALGVEEEQGAVPAVIEIRSDHQDLSPACSRYRTWRGLGCRNVDHGRDGWGKGVSYHVSDDDHRRYSTFSYRLSHHLRLLLHIPAEGEQGLGISRGLSGDRSEGNYGVDSQER